VYINEPSGLLKLPEFFAVVIFGDYDDFMPRSDESVDDFLTEVVCIGDKVVQQQNLHR
jgi:hypothetical protein